MYFTLKTFFHNQIPHSSPFNCSKKLTQSSHVKLARSTCHEHPSLHARLSRAEEHLCVIDFTVKKSFIENNDQLYYQETQMFRFNFLMFCVVDL